MGAFLVPWVHPALAWGCVMWEGCYSTACLKFSNMANIFKMTFLRAANKLDYIYTHTYTDLFPPLYYGTGLTLAPCSPFPGYQAGQVTRVTCRYFSCTNCVSLAGAAASPLLTHPTPAARLFPVCFASGVNTASSRAAPSLPVCPISLFNTFMVLFCYTIVLQISSFFYFIF